MNVWRRRLNSILLSSCVALLISTGAQAAEPNAALMCEAPAEFMSPTEYLRALSLDLRGTIPTLAELQAVQTLGSVSDSMILSMMQAPEFSQQVVRFHHKLLWPYLGNVAIHGDWLSQHNTTRVWWRGYPWARFLRGGMSSTSCRNEPEPDPSNIQMKDMGDGTYREGYVCKKPYWPVYGDASLGDCPPGEIKVCALDAQADAITKKGTVCAEAKTLDPGCGCGPDLQRCSGYAEFNGPLITSIDKQISWVIDNNRPYHEMFSHAPPFVNGQLVHYYKYIAQDLPFAVEVLPDLDYANYNTWVPVTVGKHYSGVLTHPVFLRRFQTNRGRTDRFYNSFL